MKDLKEAVKEIQGFQNEARRAKFYLELGPYNIATLLEELAEKIEEAQEELDDRENSIASLNSTITDMDNVIQALEDTINGLNELGDKSDARIAELEVTVTNQAAELEDRDD